MTAAVPEYSLVEDILAKRERLKSIHGFIIKITSGVVYSIVMHFVVITAHAFLASQFFFIYEQLVSDLLSNVGVCIFLAYFWFGIMEIGFRCAFRNEDQRLASKIRHLGHTLIFMGLNIVGVAPSKPTNALNLFYVGGSLMFWTFLVVIAVAIDLAFLEDESLIQPLV